VIREHGLGVVASYDDPDKIATMIERIRSTSYDPEPEVFNQFKRSRKIDSLVDAYESVTEEGPDDRSASSKESPS